MSRALIFILIFCVVASPARAVPQCLLYADARFEGAVLSVEANQPMPALGESFDNKISSVKVPAGCLLVGHADAGFKGAAQTWGPGSYEKLPADWDDAISSVQCNCR